MAGSGPMAGVMATGSGWAWGGSAGGALLLPLAGAGGRAGFGMALLALHVQDDVGGGLGAADEYLPVSWEFQRVGGVGDVAGEQGRHAGVADAGAAAPAGVDVAGVGEFEHAACAGAKWCGDAAAGEGDLGPGSWRPGRLVGWPAGLPDQAGGSGWR